MLIIQQTIVTYIAKNLSLEAIVEAVIEESITSIFKSGTFIGLLLQKVTSLVWAMIDKTVESIIVEYVITCVWDELLPYKDNKKEKSPKTNPKN